MNKNAWPNLSHFLGRGWKGMKENQKKRTAVTLFEISEEKREGKR